MCWIGCACFGVLLTASVATAQSAMRTWTSRSGHAIEAEWITVTHRALKRADGEPIPPETRVIQRRPDGTRFAIALAELSLDDRAYVLAHLTGMALPKDGDEVADDAGTRASGEPEASAVADVGGDPVANRQTAAAQLLALGKRFEAEGAAADAVAALDRAIALDSENAAAYQVRARLLVAQRRMSEAAHDCDDAFTLDPAYGAGTDTPAAFPWPGADWDALLRVLDDTVEASPADWGAHALRGILYGWRRFPALGMLSLNEAIDMNPYSPLCRFVRARLRADIGDAPGALADLRQLLARAPHLRACVAETPAFAALRADPEFQALVARQP